MMIDDIVERAWGLCDALAECHGLRGEELRYAQQDVETAICQLKEMLNRYDESKEAKKP